MSKINSGILHNAEPLTEEQLTTARKRAIETGEVIACINADKELCFLMPTDPKVIKELAWNRAEELHINDSNHVDMLLYRKSDTNACFLERYLVSEEAVTSPSWNFAGVGTVSAGLLYSNNGTGTVCLAQDSYASQSQLYIPALIATGPDPDTTAAVTEIAAGAFRSSDILTYVNIPPTVTSIGSHVFYECPNLTEIDLGNYEGSLPDSFSGYCPSFSTFSVGTTNKKYSTVDGLLLNAEGTALVRCPSGRTECICPNGVQEIRSCAIAYSSNLSSITLPESVTRINGYAFSYAPPGLTTITYEGSRQQWNSIIKGSGWYDFSSIEYVQCSDGLFAITGEQAFVHEYLDCHFNAARDVVTITGYKANIPTEVIIPDSISGYPVTSIGASAFKDNTSITSISIPNTVTSIGDSAFSGCSSLAAVSLGTGVKTIGASCFVGCTSLTGISLPNSLTTIGLYAFEGCTSLLAFSCSGSNRAFSALNGVLFNINQTTLLRYPPAKSATNLIIPTQVTTIADSAFSNCRHLVSVTIPAAVTTIEPFAFAGCNNIQVFRYSGTRARWNAVTKGDRWNYSSSINQVVCSDGVITL